MDVSVIIPARDAAATLGAALAGLAAQDCGARFEVIVVDDGSVDDTGEIARAGPPGVRVLHGSGEGPAAARNLGAAAASGAVLAFTDADCVPEPGWLAAGLAAFEHGDLVQGCVLAPAGCEPGPHDRRVVVTHEYGLYETANLLIRRELFERLGGFESILRPRAGIELGEDVWLGWRARRAGARTVFAGAAVVRHAVTPRGARGYIGERARLRFFPELVRRVPELRETFLFRRVFLNRRTALFDLAAAGVLAALAGGHRAPLLLAAPYTRDVARGVSGRPDAPRLALAELAADGVSAVALGIGSLRSRSLLA